MKRIYLTLVPIFLFFHFNLSGQLEADFNANTLSGCDFETITFTNLSTDGGNLINCTGNFSYSWDFNPGTSNQCSPGNIFSTPGTYTVCLTTTNNTTGESDTECKTDYITIFPLPEPSFTFNPSSGCAPQEICFENTTTLQSGNLIECIWDFADGTVVNDCTPGQICHTFQIGGTYNVSLTVIDDNGCPPVTTIQPVQIFFKPDIQVTANENFSCTPPLVVDFNNITPGASNIDFTWQFEGANTPFFQGNNPPPLTWSNQGNYDVTITAVNSITGCNDTLILDDYINIGSAVDFSVSSYSLCLGDTLYLTDQSEGNPISWNWDFGDGIGTSTLPNPFYVFTSPGCYPISLNADNGACVGTVTDPTCITVDNIPTVSFTNNNPVGCEIPHTVNFNSITSGGAISAYEWTFGDDPVLGTSSQPDPSFTFTELGVHPVTLTITTAGGGCQVVFMDTIRIEEIDVDLLNNSIEGCVPITVTLMENSTSVAPINDWVWTIPGIGTFNEQSPTVNAVDTGEYDVILQVTNDFGCVATDTFFSYIQTGIPQAVEFSADPLSTCIDTEISFTDLSSPDVDEWFWQFGDGPSSVSFAQNPVHEYLDTGFFEVCLTVFQNGCPNSLCKPDYVYLIPPRADFRDSFECNNPYLHYFTDISLGSDSVFYDFGVPGIDTDTSSERNPTFTFPDIGVYTVTQTVYNFETGCDEMAIQLINISDPTADFIISDNIGCTPFTINLIDTSTSAVFYEWISPNAIIDDPNSPNPTITYTEGEYTNELQLVVSDTFGCFDTLVYPQTITSNKIFPNFTYSDTVGCAPLQVDFNDASLDLYSNINQWEWNFNNGNGWIIGGPNMLHTFTYADSFRVRLRVTDELGCVSTAGHFIIVKDVYPTFFSDTVACTGQEVDFVNLSTATNLDIGEALSYLWDFGDGNTSTDINPVHSYAAEGVYDVCLTIENQSGCDSTLCIPNYMNVIDPVADFEADTTFGFCPPLIVNFINQSQNSVSGGYTWDFGDNTGLSNADEPSHVYTGAGVFDVSLISTSPSGCKDTLLIEEYIELQGPVGSFGFEPDSGCVPLTVTFVTNSLAPVLHIMDYGDGSIDSSAIIVAQDTFVYTYTEAGAYQPALILVDDLGCDQVFDSDSLIIVESLEIDFMATDTLLCDGGMTDLSSSVTSSIPITLLEWELEGQTPTTSNDPNPSGLTYNSFGEYDVQLTVSNGVCTDSLIKPDYIVIEPKPVAQFQATPDSGCTPLDVVFTDQSSVSSGVITQWDWDIGDGTTSDLTNPTHTYADSGSYTVVLEVTTENGCKDTIDNPVEVLAVPDVITLPGGTICIGEVYQLEAQILTDPQGVSISWDNSNSLSCSDCLTPAASPTVTTTYTITITHPNGCTDQAQVTLDVLPFPVPNIGLERDTAICEGETIQLIASGGTTPDSYQWDTNSPGLSCYECANPFATPTIPTTYIVSVTGPGGCFATDTIDVDVFDPSREFAGPDRIVCEGDTVSLDYGGFGNNPTWSPSTDLSCVFCPYPIASPADTTTYTVTINDPIAGCQITDTVIVNVIPIGNIDAGEDSDICRGDNIQLNGTGFGTSSWSPSSSLDDPNILNPIATVNEPTWYYLTSSSGSCSLVDSVFVGVLDSASVSVRDAFICLGDTTFLFADGDASSYSWTPTEGLSDPTSNNPEVFVTDTTTYTVTASLGSCPSATATATVFVQPLPDDASIYPVYTFYPGNPVQLNIEVENPAALYGYEWLPESGLTCYDCQSPVAVIDSTAYYDILVSDLETGCKTLLHTELKPLAVCSPDNLAVPNAFTPNGDGNNDVLYVRTTGIQDILIFRVYNRWGELVFETENISVGWDGTHKGKPVNPGVYVYYVQGLCPIDGSELFNKGNVTVIR